MKKHLFLNFFVFCLSIFSFAQPANDDCAGAIALTINTSCTYATYDNLLATGSVDAAPACASYSTGDVWFSFVVPAGGIVTANTNVGSITDSGMAWYTGVCGALTEIACSDDDSENGTMSKITQTGLTPGETIYIRFWDYFDGTGTFDICVSEPPSAPANDECLNAISLLTNLDNTCTSFTSATIESATASVEVDDCAIGSADDDVWFSFVATNTSHTINLNNITGSVTDMFHSVYSGACASLGTATICSDANFSLATGLTIGNTYIVRAFTNTATPLQTTDFDICVKTPPNAPLNDECVNATVLTTNPDLTCTAFTSSSIESATASVEVDDCAIGSADDDVWFSFVATDANHALNLNNVIGSTTDMYHSVYSGACASLGTAIVCSDPNTSSLTGLTIGNTYTVRVFTTTAVTAQNTTFDVCVTTLPPPPVNDDCAGAIPLTVNTSCSYATYTNDFATNSNGVADPTCAFYSGGDVWFSFVVPAGGIVTANSNIGTMTDSGMAWYTGTCGTLVEIACSDDDSENGAMSLITQSGLTPGETVFIRFWDYGGGFGTFDICVSEPPNAPANDECINAVSLTPNADLTCVAPTSGTIESATASAEVNDCATSTADDDVWYSFVATNANHQIDLSNISGTDFFMSHAVYSGSCASLSASLVCSDVNSSTVTGLTVGNTYFIRTFTTGATPLQNTSFDICVTTPPPPPTNDDCANAIPLSVGTSCTYSTFTNSSSSASTDADPSCASYSGGDVWFSLVVPASGSVTVNSNTNGGMNDSGMAWYTGSCGSLTELECDDDDSENGNMSKITQTGLTPGETIYIRFYGYGGQTGSFDICASVPPNPPANDECATAISVTASSTSNCLTPVSGTLTSATASVDVNACGTGTADDDVWFSFVATSTSHTISISNIVGSTTDFYHSVYAGSCGALGAEIKCSDPNSSTTAGLTIGNTYYVRIFTWTATTGQVADFDICITNPLIVGPTISAGTTSDPSVCNASDGSIQINGLNSGTGTLSWIGTSSGSIAGVTLPHTISTFTAGTYDFTFDDGNMSNTISVSLVNPSAPATPTVSADGPLTFCANEDVVLTSSAVSGNTWSTGETTQSITVNTAGTYTVFETVASCPSALSSDVVVDVISNVTPSIVISSDDVDNSICDGTNVTFTATPTNGGVLPSFQWMVNALPVGTNSPTYSNATLVDGDVVTCDLTSSEMCADPMTVSSNSIATTVNAIVAPSVLISSNVADNTICEGSNVIFTAVPTNGGSTPSYQWMLNALPVGTDSDTYSSSTLINGDIISCILTSNDECANPLTANSNDVNMIVNPILTPSAVVVSDDIDNTICEGTNVTFTVTPTNGGLTPAYLWFVNGSATTNNTDTYSSSTLVNGDMVSVELNSSEACTDLNPVNSNSIVITVNPILVPSVVIVSDDLDNDVCPTTNVTFTATPTNGGTTPMYQWMLNGLPVGIDSDTYSNATLVDGDIVSCDLTSNALCANPILGNSNAITMAVNTTLIASISIDSDIANDTICAGTTVTFTATPLNEGLTPTYQWMLNGVMVGTNSNTYSNASLVDGDAVTCDLTTSDVCASPMLTSSNSITTTVNPILTPSVTIVSDDLDNTICQGNTVIFAATAINGGTNTTYQWKKNGNNMNGQTNDTLIFSNFNNNDIITCRIISDDACANPLNAISNEITITVNPKPTITVNGVTNTSTCGVSDGSFTINGTGTGDLSWTGTNPGTSGTVTLPFTVSNLALGSYQIVFTDLCPSNTVNANINEPATPSVPTISVSGATTFCDGGSVILTSSASNNIQWSTGETTQSITVTTSGDYTVTKTNAFGCSSTSLIETVTVNPNPATAVITASGATLFCIGGSVTLTSDLATDNVWSTGETTSSIDVSVSGSYSVTTTLNGCTKTSNVIDVTVSTIPSILLGGINGTTSCGGNDGTIDIIGSGSGIISWTGTSSGTMTGILPAQIQGLAAGSYDITFDNGCISNTVSGSINDPIIPTAPTITVQGNTSFCEGESVILTSSTSTGNVWSTGETTQSITVNTAGDYNTTVSSAPNCDATSNTVSIVVNPIPATPTVTANGSTTFCDGENVTLTSSSTNGNTWSTNETSETITVTNSGNYFVTVDENGCTATSNPIAVTVNPVPLTPLISGSLNICEGSSVILSSDISSTIQWSTGETTTSITVSTAGTFSVTNTVNGCSSTSAEVTTVVNPVPNVSISSISDICDTSATFTLNQGSPVGGIYTVNGTTATSFDPSATNIGINTVEYTVTQNGCSNSASTTFDVLDCSGSGIVENNINVNVYPNPTSGKVSISGFELNEIQSISVYDEVGRIILRVENTNEVNLENLSNGIYRLHLITDKGNSIVPIQLVK
jgi:hypothetical protein